MSAVSIADFLLGDSAAMRQLREQIARVGPTRLPALLQGPTGSGKELAARALHAASMRNGPLVAVNVCAIADTMFEDAMFGHVHGAFSGAVRETLGYLAEADRGTIFLDEIGGLSPEAQAKLLRAIETGEFRQVGARRDRHSDFRVIAAANEDLFALAAAGRFRVDLVHRLSAVVIRVPGLDQRGEDIPLLARHFAHATSGTVQLTDGALRYLQSRPWPGNVRELRHVVECAVALARGAIVHRDDVAALTRMREGVGAEAGIEELERRRVLSALEQNRWNIGATAAWLGIHRATLSRWMRRLRIERPTSRLGRELRPSLPRRADGDAALAEVVLR